jgi:hypothetical protein
MSRGFDVVMKRIALTAVVAITKGPPAEAAGIANSL